MQKRYVGIYNKFTHETEALEEYDLARGPVLAQAAIKKLGPDGKPELDHDGKEIIDYPAIYETGKDEYLRAIERMQLGCRAKNPQYVDEATGKAYEVGPWLVYDSDKPFDWSLVDRKPTDAEKASNIRLQRNALLAASDWTKNPERPLSTSEAAAWKAYRAALFDITAQKTFPESVQWPEAPHA